MSEATVVDIGPASVEMVSKALMAYHQIDEDGTNCGVSRQAVHEASAMLCAMRDALTAREIDLSERTSQRDAWRERAFKAETSLTARDKALDAANKLWRLCVCESCYGDCDTCYQAIDKLEDLK